jgi:hypothetical protein
MMAGFKLGLCLHFFEDERPDPVVCNGDRLRRGGKKLPIHEISETV